MSETTGQKRKVNISRTAGNVNNRFGNKNWMITPGYYESMLEQARSNKSDVRNLVLSLDPTPMSPEPSDEEIIAILEEATSKSSMKK